MDIQWYPGHMTKARRQMQEDLKLIDLIIELVDARIPVSSRNPDIGELGKGKARLILMNKADLADDAANRKWLDFFKSQGYHALLIDSRSGKGVRSIGPIVQEACKEKIERDARRGIKNRPIRAMVVGIPNVGKSTFINSYAGRACAKTGNKPGVTKGKQWIRLGKGLELLDTPGILWPKFDDPEVGKRLAIIGSVKDELLNVEELSLSMMKFLKETYPGTLHERYQADESKTEVDNLYEIAANRQCVLKGGDPDTVKAASILMDDYRSGKLGKISLEHPAAE
ncbi:MAG: ribosome biogenesis GTPase YlqF [Lachnospiraceae bacterium]|nr:ribosome biogenesis GTPase YlqF [Lachnospiraceae bacterium]